MTTHRRPPGRLRPLLSSVVLRTQTDQRLAALAQEGRQQAFAAIFDRYGRELRAHAARVVRAASVDDVIQEAMLSSWAALLSGGEIADLRAWLHRIVHNAALNTIARRGYDDLEIPPGSVAPALTDELADGRITLAQALAAVAALPATQRRALTLTAIEGRSGRVTAEALGLSENATRQLVHRARAGVRSAMSAVTPLPLVSWISDAARDGAATNAIATGGMAATAIKLTAVVGVTGVALGGAHALQVSREHHRHDARAAAGLRVPPRSGAAGSRALRRTTPGLVLINAINAPVGARLDRAPSHLAGGGAPAAARVRAGSGGNVAPSASTDFSGPRAGHADERRQSGDQGSRSGGDGHVEASPSPAPREGSANGGGAPRSSDQAPGSTDGSRASGGGASSPGAQGDGSGDSARSQAPTAPVAATPAQASDATTAPSPSSPSPAAPAGHDLQGTDHSTG